MGTGLLSAGLDVCKGPRAARTRPPRAFGLGHDPGADLVGGVPFDPGRFDSGKLNLVQQTKQQISISPDIFKDFVLLYIKYFLALQPSLTRIGGTLGSSVVGSGFSEQTLSIVVRKDRRSLRRALFSGKLQKASTSSCLLFCSLS